MKKMILVLSMLIVGFSAFAETESFQDPKTLNEMGVELPQPYNTVRVPVISLRTDDVLSIVEKSGNTWSFESYDGKVIPFFQTRGAVIEHVVRKIQNAFTDKLKNERNIDIDPDSIKYVGTSDSLDENQGRISIKYAGSAYTAKGTALFISFEIVAETQDISFMAEFPVKYDNEGNLVPFPALGRIGKMVRLVGYTTGKISVINQKTSYSLGEINEVIGSSLPIITKF